MYLVEGLAAAGLDNVLVCVPNTPVDAAARRLGIPVVNLDCAGDLDLSFAWRLRRLLAREHPDLLHCHSRRGADVLGGLAAATSDVPAVLTRRVDNPEPEWRARLRYRPYAKVVAISDNVADVLRESGLPEERMLVTVGRHANTSAASVPLALAEAADAGKLRPNQIVVINAMGGGFTWGAALLRW